MTPSDLPPVKLECRSVWKIFGERAAQIVAAAGGVPDEVALTRAGLVAAVCDVNLEVREIVKQLKQQVKLSGLTGGPPTGG